MPASRKTNFVDQDQFLQLRRAGQSYRAIGRQTGWARETVRKYCRGAGRPAAKLGRPAGCLGSFDPLVRFAALRLKRQHPGWGPIVILDELSELSHLRGRRLPRRSQLATYYQQFGSRLITPHLHRQLPPPVAPLPEPSERIVFQLDAQERISLPRLGQFNRLDIRAPGWGLLVGCYPHPAPRGQRVSLAQTRDDCRATFQDWGLPDVVQTDHDPLLVPSGNHPFPSDFTLWLAGLDIHHQLISRVTQNGSVERSHQTCHKQMVHGSDPADWPTFLAHVRHEQKRLNERLPSWAKACQGQVPLAAHPEARTPQRPYTRATEADLFDLRRIHAYLAGGRWIRLTSDRGQFNLGDRVWSVGSAHAHQPVVIRFDSAAVCFTVSSSNDTVLTHLPGSWLSADRIRGLDAPPN
jgi:hypothetical protein